MPEIIAVTTNKGGVLKTTTTVNLASCYALADKKVLIIDTDNQGNAAVSFGLNPDQLELTLYDVLADNLDPQKAITNVYQNIDILPSNDDMSFLEFDVLSERERYPKPFYLLRNSFKGFDLGRYDIVLIDCPPNIGLTTGNVLSFADYTLIPFQPESFSMRSLIKILNAINEFKDNHNPNLKILGVLATLVDSRTHLHSAITQECRKYCVENNIRMLDTVIPKSVRFANSVAYEQLPAVLTDKKHPIVQSYQNIYKELNENGKER